MDKAETARKRIKQAIRAPRNGGVQATADRAGVHWTTVYRFLRGQPLSRENASRLRSAVQGVPAHVWLDACVPVETPAAEAQQ